MKRFLSTISIFALAMMMFPSVNVASANTPFAINFYDTDHNGRIDRALVQIRESAKTMDLRVHDESGWSVTYDGDDVEILEVIGANQKAPGQNGTVTLELNDSDFVIDIDTTVDLFEVSYTQTSGANTGTEYSNVADMQLSAFNTASGPAVVKTDVASPIMINAEYFGDGFGDVKDVILTFSEDVEIDLNPQNNGSGQAANPTDIDLNVGSDHTIVGVSPAANTFSNQVTVTLDVLNEAAEGRTSINTFPVISYALSGVTNAHDIVDVTGRTVWAGTVLNDFLTDSAGPIVNQITVLNETDDIATETITVPGMTRFFVHYSEVMGEIGGADVSIEGIGLDSSASALCDYFSGVDEPTQTMICFDYDVPANVTANYTGTVSLGEDKGGNVQQSPYNFMLSLDTGADAAPRVTAVSSDGETFTEVRTENIKITFDQSMSQKPTVFIEDRNRSVTGPEEQSVDACADSDLTTFCFDYEVPSDTDSAYNIIIDDAVSATTAISMNVDASHQFAVNTPAVSAGGNTSGGGNNSGSNGGSTNTSLLPTPGTCGDIVGHWGEDYFDDLTAEGVVRPDENSDCNPDEVFSREALIQLAVDLYELEAPNANFNEKPFDDVELDHPYFEAIVIAKANGVIRGYGLDGAELRPDRGPSRAEGLQIFAEAAGYNFPRLLPNTIDPNSDHEFRDLMARFSDILWADSWYNHYLDWALENQFIEGYQDGTMKPDQQITTAEAMKLAYVVWDFAN